MSAARKWGPVVLLSLAALAPPAAAQRVPDAITLTNVHVVDPAQARVDRNRVVVIRQGRITAVGRRGEVPVPRGGRTVDTRGAFLIPGLWDMHVHLSMAGRSALPVLVAAGVTAVRDMGDGYALVKGWQDSVDAGSLLGPRIFTVGAVVEHARWKRAVVGLLSSTGDSLNARSIAARLGVETAEEATRAVDSVVSLGARAIKVRNAPPRAGYFALLRQARARGIDVVGHPPSRDVSLREASDSGQRSIEHLLVDVGSDGITRSTLDALPEGDRTSLYERFRANGTVFVPTLIAGVGMRRTADSVVLGVAGDSAGRRDPRRRYVSPLLAEAWRRQVEMKRFEGTQPDWETLYRAAAARLRDLDAAGVVVLAGTDLGTPLTYPGFALHDELELQVREGGRTPAQALRGATTGAATFMGREQDSGAIAPGRLADLVLLGGNPLDDISNVRRVRAVIRDGRYLDRGALDALLEGAVPRR